MRKHCRSATNLRPSCGCIYSTTLGISSTSLLVGDEPAIHSFHSTTAIRLNTLSGYLLVSCELISNLILYSSKKLNPVAVKSTRNAMRNMNLRLGFTAKIFGIKYNQLSTLVFEINHKTHKPSDIFALLFR